jgi:hypothetical protein
MCKKLSYILRHGATSVGLKVREDGFVRVKDLLGLKDFQSYNLESLQRIVAEDEKKRYRILHPCKSRTFFRNRRRLDAYSDHGSTSNMLPCDVPTQYGIHQDHRLKSDESEAYPLVGKFGFKIGKKSRL